MEDLPTLQESIQKFDVPEKMGCGSKDTCDSWQYGHFQVTREHILVILGQCLNCLENSLTCLNYEKPPGFREAKQRLAFWKEALQEAVT